MHDTRGIWNDARGKLQPVRHRLWMDSRHSDRAFLGSGLPIAGGVLLASETEEKQRSGDAGCVLYGCTAHGSISDAAT